MNFFDAWTTSSRGSDPLVAVPPCDELPFDVPPDVMSRKKLGSLQPITMSARTKRPKLILFICETSPPMR
jgi:hypothetical protein